MMFRLKFLKPFSGMTNPLQRIKKREYKNLPIYILMLTCTSKWFIEGVVDQTILTVLFLGLGLGLLVLKKGIQIQRPSAIWLIYCFSIMLSVLISGGGFNVWGRALIYVLIVLYAVLAGYEDFDLGKAVKLLIGLSLFYAFFIFIQYLFTEGFNDLYFPLLSDTTGQRAELYSRRGYYFGLHTSPHEVAGILAFAIAALLFRILLIGKEKKSLKLLVPVIALVVALFLTGKKGVLLAFAGAFVVTAVIMYGSKKQWKKALIAVGMSVLILIVALVIIRSAPDNALFYRLNQFIDQLLSGQAVGSDRMRLYQHAINAWKDNKLFGIGWYQFVALSTTEFGYSAAHQVNLDYLQWLCETGIVGVILNLIPLLVTFCQALIVGVKALSNIKEQTKKWTVLFAIFIQIFTVAYAFVEIPFYDVYFFGVYMLSCMIVNGVYVTEIMRTNKEPCCLKKVWSSYEQRRKTG